MENFYSRVMGWASARNILKGSPWTKQRTKTWEELTELAEGISKSNLTLAKDAIGDCFVTVTNMAGCMGLDPINIGAQATLLAKEESREFDHYDLDGLLNVFVLHVAIARPLGGLSRAFDVWTDTQPEDHLTIALAALEHCTTRLGLSFEDCQEHAWSEIKDRKGLMISGSFVKEKDLQASMAYALTQATNAIASNHTAWKLAEHEGKLQTEEQFLSRFHAMVRAELSKTIDPSKFGLHAGVEVTVNPQHLVHGGSFYGGVEVLTVVTHMIVELGDTRPIVVTAIAPVVCGLYNPGDNGGFEVMKVNSLNLRDSECSLVRQHVHQKTVEKVGKRLAECGTISSRLTSSAVYEKTFDNDVPFYDVHISSRNNREETPTYYVGAVTLV